MNQIGEPTCVFPAWFTDVIVQMQLVFNSYPAMGDPCAAHCDCGLDAIRRYGVLGGCAIPSKWPERTREGLVIRRYIALSPTTERQSPCDR